MKRYTPIAGVLLLAFALRVHHLAHLSLWLDESYSVFAAQLSLSESIQFVASRSHPPLYFLVLYGWIELGDSEFVIRFLSVMWGLLGVAALFALGRRLFGERIGLLAALLVAVSPIHVWHSQDARMYTQLFTLVVLSSYLLAMALSRNQALFWLGYAVFASLGLYTHNTALFTILAQALFCLLYVIVRRKWHLLWGLVGAQVGIGLLYLPWLPLAATQTSHLQQYFWISRPTGRTVLETFDYLSSAFLFNMSPWHSNLDTWPGSLIYLTFLGLFLLGSWYLLRRYRLWAAFLLLLLAVPIIGEYALSYVRPIYLNRTLLAVAAPLFLVYAAGAVGDQKKLSAVGGFLLLVAVGCNLVSLNNLYTRAEKEEWRQAAELVAQRAQAGDLILFDQGLVQIPFDYYFQPYGITVEEFGYPYEYTHGQTQSTMGSDQWWIADYVNADPDSAVERLIRLAAQHPTVWLVTNRPLSEGRLVTWLAENSKDVENHAFHRVTVERFDR